MEAQEVLTLGHEDVATHELARRLHREIPDNDNFDDLYSLEACGDSLGALASETSSEGDKGGDKI